MITIDGFASANENPSIGPPVYSMVRFGAKESALIIKKDEWWRIISPTMLHAGIIHIVPNVAIQVSVCSMYLFFFHLYALR
jgi:membrane associated rhomboid family serine protease